MNLYSYSYCKAFDWYNTKGEKEDTQRVSAIVLLSIFPTLSLLSVLFLIGTINWKTPGNALWAVGVYAIFLIADLLTISTKKSTTLRDEYKQISHEENKRWKFFSIIHLGQCFYAIALTCN